MKTKAINVTQIIITIICSFVVISLYGFTKSDNKPENNEIQETIRESSYRGYRIEKAYYDGKTFYVLIEGGKAVAFQR